MKEEQVKESAEQSSLSERTNRMDDFVKEHAEQWEFKKCRKVNNNIEPELQTDSNILSDQTEPTKSTESSVLTASTRRTSSKQRKASLDEYRELFLRTPKITDRQPVFVSRTTRDSIDDIVRRLGERRMSVSGFLENLANHHLETYREEVEQWKRL